MSFSWQSSVQRLCSGNWCRWSGGRKHLKDNQCQWSDGQRRCTTTKARDPITKDVILATSVGGLVTRASTLTIDSSNMLIRLPTLLTFVLS